MNVLRTEDPVFLTGRANYTDDIHLTGMLHGAVPAQPAPAREDHRHRQVTGRWRSTASSRS